MSVYEVAFIVLIFFGVFVPPLLGAVCGRIWDAFRPKPALPRHLQAKVDHGDR